MGLWGLIKLVLIAVAVYWLYRGLRGLLGGQGRVRPQARPGSGQTEVLDVMVQDPNCGTYVPQSEAVRARIKGEEAFFCSQKCRDEYKGKNS